MMKRLLPFLAVAGCAVGGPEFTRTDPGYQPTPAANAPQVILAAEEVPPGHLKSVGYVVITVHGPGDLREAVATAQQQGQRLGCWAMVEDGVFAATQGVAPVQLREAAPKPRRDDNPGFQMHEEDKPNSPRHNVGDEALLMHVPAGGSGRGVQAQAGGPVPLGLAAPSRFILVHDEHAGSAPAPPVPAPGSGSLPPRVVFQCVVMPAPQG